MGISTALRASGVARGADMGVETCAEDPTKGPIDWVTCVAKTLGQAKIIPAPVRLAISLVLFMTHSFLFCCS
jgi:hypothetical protein